MKVSHLCIFVSLLLVHHALEFISSFRSAIKLGETHITVMARPTGIGIRNRILAFSQAGLSQNAIAGRLGITRETVNRILKRNRETRRLDPGKSTGRPRISTARVDRVLARLARQDRFKSCSVLRAEWVQRTHVRANRRTINGRLILMGYRARRCVVNV